MWQNDWQSKVAEFHTKFDCPIRTTPGAISAKDKLRRSRLIVSESAEFVESADKDDIVGMIDALCDIIFVVLGTACEMGVDLHPFFMEVCRSNLTKSAAKDSGGKILKGNDYSPPDLLPYLKAQGYDK